MQRDLSATADLFVVIDIANKMSVFVNGFFSFSSIKTSLIGSTFSGRCGNKTNICLCGV